MQSAPRGEFGLSGLHGQVANQADLCSCVLREARQLVVTERFGPALGQLLFRAADLLDQMNETLVGVDPDHHPEAFASVAALHSELDYIQAHVPPHLRTWESPDSAGRNPVS